MLLGIAGGFASQQVVPIAPAAFPQAVAAGDVDGDGDLDLVVAMRDLDAVGLVTNNGDAGFSAVQPIGAADNPESIALDDVNGDGRLDVLFADGDANALGVILSSP